MLVPSRYDRTRRFGTSPGCATRLLRSTPWARPTGGGDGEAADAHSSQPRDGAADFRPPDPPPTLTALPGRLSAATITTSRGQASFQLWTPDATKVVRGLLVVTNQSYAATLPYYQEMASLAGFGVVGSNLGASNARQTDFPKVMVDALAALATASGRQEIRTAPLLLSGFSTGASVCSWILESLPDRIIAVALVGHRIEPMAPAARRVPYSLMVSEADPDANAPVNFVDATTKVLPSLRADGSPFAVAITWGTGHGYAASANLAIPFFLRSIARRLPAAAAPSALMAVNEADGWLGDPTTWSGTYATVAPFGDYKGDKARAPWLLDGYLAAIWRGYDSKAPPVRIDSPPAIRVGANPTNGQQYAGFPTGPVPVAVSVAEGAAVARVELYDGDRKLDERDQPPFRFSPTLAPGFHALMAVLSEPSGRRHVSKVHTIFVR